MRKLCDVECNTPPAVTWRFTGLKFACQLHGTQVQRKYSAVENPREREGELERKQHGTTSLVVEGVQLNGV